MHCRRSAPYQATFSRRNGGLFLIMHMQTDFSEVVIQILNFHSWKSIENALCKTSDLMYQIPNINNYTR